MELSLTIDAIREDVVRLAALGDEGTAAAADRIAAALGPSVTVRLLDLLGNAAHEVSQQMSSGRVELRVSGTDASLVVIEDHPSADSIPTDGDLTARFTLRLPEQLKSLVESAASGEGVSANAWISRAVSKAAASGSKGHGGGKTMQGFGRS
ncbi:MAG TPA: toxin-antitoxin system HicB family antitoxin [Acidimicrobiales bacterium]|nr:toxin-antitoxin system HicB family antitoxin [Acidimicrobiales bacterium]